MRPSTTVCPQSSISLRKLRSRLISLNKLSRKSIETGVLGSQIRSATPFESNRKIKSKGWRSLTKSQFSHKEIM
jgi:hypothetical protein